jgi:hypothetical protein
MMAMPPLPAIESVPRDQTLESIQGANPFAA